MNLMKKPSSLLTIVPYDEFDVPNLFEYYKSLFMDNSTNIIEIKSKIKELKYYLKIEWNIGQ